MLLVEAMAQGAGIVLGRQEPELRARGAVLAAIDHCDLTGSVGIGDQLEVEITVVRRYAGMARIRARASVGTRTCATAALTLAFAPELRAGDGLTMPPRPAAQILPARRPAASDRRRSRSRSPPSSCSASGCARLLVRPRAPP